MGRVSTHSIRKLKNQKPVVCLTAYDTLFATLADQAGVDIILVGDSLGTTFLGYETTIPVTEDDMAHHVAAVARAKPNAMVVADMPFALGSYSFDKVLASCARFMQKCGADAVKIEGGEAYAPAIARLTQAGVPVMGHIGLLPQRVNEIGRYRRFGKTDAERDQLIRDAKAIEAAGAFCIVIEMVTHDVAAQIASEIKVPLIGIGSGAGCDGQIIVCTDILGLTLGSTPSFAKRYAELGTAAREAFTAYATEVREGKFPEKDQ